MVTRVRLRGEEADTARLTGLDRLAVIAGPEHTSERLSKGTQLFPQTTSKLLTAT